MKTLRDSGEISEKRRVTVMGRNRDAGKRKCARGLKEEDGGQYSKEIYVSHRGWGRVGRPSAHPIRIG